ncbi:MAG: AAA family ATPase [Clostridia bacterium]|jgi:DNA repair protein RecN (Recombination protein N)|nr:AAA family ATPase [Clostridia bacterium]
MISTLHIKNVGIIDDVTIDLNEGLNILTGETGAGKTLIIDSLQIISGGRFSKEMIRKGQDFSFVEASIYLKRNYENQEENVVISREIFANGRNTCKINGRLVAVRELKNYMKNIIDIHGQHENVSLLDESTHIKFLDNFAEKEIQIYKSEYLEKYKRYKELKEEINKNFGDEKEKQRELDLLKYQNREIEASKLKKDEEENLEAKRKVILNSEKIANNLKEASSQIGSVSIESISKAIRALEKISNLDTKYEKSLNALKSIYYDMQELSIDIEACKEEVYFEEDKREQIEMRLDLIYTLKRKYGNSIEEILSYNEEVKERISKIENSEEYVGALKKELKMLKIKMEELSQKMHTIRGKHAKILDEKINNELSSLEMQNAKFSAKLEYNEEKNLE